MRVRRLLATVLFRVARWRVVGGLPRSGIFVGAPHTSNWDFVITLLVLWREGVPPRVLMKRELFRGPLAPLLRACGGVPIDRATAGLVRRLAAERTDGTPFVVVLAAEGTRSKTDHWKSGFYRLAQQTGLPVTLGFVDGPSRTAGIGPTFHPTGDLRADMDLVRAFYADKRGLHPERRSDPRLREEAVPPAA